jgi:hypothetical protein
MYVVILGLMHRIAHWNSQCYWIVFRILLNKNSFEATFNRCRHCDKIKIHVKQP